MIWISVISGFAGGVAFAIIGVPLTFWLLRAVLLRKGALLLPAPRSSQSAALSDPARVEVGAGSSPGGAPAHKPDYPYSYGRPLEPGNPRIQAWYGHISYPPSLTGWPEI